LETELQIEKADGTVRLLQGANVIAEGRSASLDLTPPAPPSHAEAMAASRAYIGFKHHVFPRCFVCGPQRADGDGLRIFPGALGDGVVVAAPWIPHASLSDGRNGVGPEYLWSALDCTSGFAVLPVPEGSAIVLGELCARIDGGVSVGEACVVI